MLRFGRSIAVIIAVTLPSAGATVYAQEAGTARAEGRRLDEALGDLQKRGLKIIYSTQVVRPDMRVPVELRGTSLHRR